MLPAWAGVSSREPTLTHTPMLAERVPAICSVTTRRPLGRTVRRTREHVAAVADPAMLKGRRYGNVVLAASRAALPAAGSADAAALAKELLGGSLPAQYKDTAWCRQLAAETQPWHDKPADQMPAVGTITGA